MLLPSHPTAGRVKLASGRTHVILYQHLPKFLRYTSTTLLCVVVPRQVARWNGTPLRSPRPPGLTPGPIGSLEPVCRSPDDIGTTPLCVVVPPQTVPWLSAGFSLPSSRGVVGCSSPPRYRFPNFLRYTSTTLLCVVVPRQVAWWNRRSFTPRGLPASSTGGSVQVFPPHLLAISCDVSGMVWPARPAGAPHCCGCARDVIRQNGHGCCLQGSRSMAQTMRAPSYCPCASGQGNAPARGRVVRCSTEPVDSTKTVARRHYSIVWSSGGKVASCRALGSAFSCGSELASKSAQPMHRMRY